MRANGRSPRRELSGEAGVHARNHEVERNQGQVGEQPLDKRLSSGALRSLDRSVNPM